MGYVGLLLAAGAGVRMGRPKALVEGWLGSSLTALLDGGCAEVSVVLGAAADRARALLDEATRADACLASVRVVVAEEWASGMGASMRAGLESLDRAHGAALVHLVDLPDVGADVIRRVGGHAAIDVLARASYHAVPGHPVLLGRDHWAPAAATLTGDEGARAYLRAHDVTLVECGDLAEGRDVDRPQP
ncbi:MAG: NTP transferase domain-containing protein [Nocardioides sp.]|uniref:nucleotidyltransferase family protein n=1 Tax=Nocardioides sp. TaxID=35761 RepID=UPI0039E4E799